MFFGDELTNFGEPYDVKGSVWESEEIAEGGTRNGVASHHIEIVEKLTRLLIREDPFELLRVEPPIRLQVKVYRITQFPKLFIKLKNEEYTLRHHLDLIYFNAFSESHDIMFHLIR